MAKFFCPHCHGADPVPISESQCPVCRRELVSPNIRLASDAGEVLAFQRRVDDARVQLRARNCEAEGEAFATQAALSSAVVCRAPGHLLELVSNPNSIYSTFYNQLDGQSRLPQDNEYDQWRAVIDAIMFPNFFRSIVFAALSLNGLGVVAYGACSIVLKEVAFAHRASVFHENSFKFIKDYKLKATDPLPHGYRATWDRRAELALAKLHGRVNSSMSTSDYAEVLLRQKTATVEDDFIEVHIFGGFSRGAIERIVVTQPEDRIERHVLKGVVAKARAASIPVEMR
ncbi:MAG: hypothetical protein LCH93_11100 [Proteobacteria bacterium]|nr:hypothetical protein [Pseudomonadota bacterium]